MRPLFAILIVFSPFANLVSQPDTAGSIPHPRFVLLSECASTAWIMRPSKRGVPFFADIGPLWKLGRNQGFGWTVMFDVTRETPFIATGPRYRRWHGRGFTTDLGASVVVTGGDPFTAVLRLAGGYRDIVGLHVRMDYGGWDGVVWGMGAQLGSTPGLAATGAGGVLLVVAKAIQAIHWAGYRGDL